MKRGNLIILFVIICSFFLAGCTSQTTHQNALQGNVVFVETVHEATTGKEVYQASDSGNVIVSEKEDATPQPVKVYPTVVQPARVIDQDSLNAIYADFHGVTHSVEGEVAIYWTRDASKTGTDSERLRIVEFSEDFKSEYGPELHVYLSTLSQPLRNHEFVEGEFTDLGGLKKLAEEQVYVIPDNHVPFSSIVLYSPAFNEVYGYARIN